jgi:hypothetical protein
MACDRLLDLVAPNCVSSNIYVADDKAADRGEHLRNITASVLAAGPGHVNPVENDRVNDRACVEAKTAQPQLVVGLAKHRKVTRQMPHGACIEMILMHMRDHDDGDASNDLLGRGRQRDERVAPVVVGIFDGRSGSDIVQHRINQK